MKKVCLGGYGKLKYELYEDGTVVSVGHISSRGYEVQDKILTYSMRNGYKCVTMNLDGKSKYYYLHRLLAQNFIENPNDYPCVNHIDGNKINNEISNLERCTYSQNNKHAFATGLKAPTILRHEAHGGRKLTEKDIEYIREHYIKGDRKFGQCALGRKFNVHQGHIWRIINNKIWN